jgi:UDP-N-acetylglucosamine 4,6-dehydratase/5-epimerase|tara:strand:+ start:2234 stop:3181 length:948 start_codon:yes stop_codon:yes gene_type:complete
MKNKKILILGGTGALGKTLTERYYKQNDVIIFSRDEHKHVNMKRKYPNISYQIGDVKDKDSILQVLNEYKPDIVINTAALKHVPICEDNPYESVKTNIIGHKNLIDSISICNHQIETLMFISTDKACKPINVYGMSKAISERLYIDFANKQTDIKVVLCRYGNVLESTGSVIPFFKGLLEQGHKTLPITDERMTRFSITLDESVDLIEWAFNHPESHGNIIVPKLDSLKVVDIAKELGKHFSQFDIDLEYIGIRQGEKIHEEMVSLEESFRTKEFPKYYMITDNIINKKGWSYASDSSILNQNEVFSFLKSKKVI